MVAGMGIFDRLFPRAVTGTAELLNAQATIARHQRSTMLPGIVPPSRSGDSVTLEDATSLHSVYRAMEILTGAAAQLSIDSKRQGRIIPDPPAILRRPSLDMDRPDFIEETMMSFIVDGNFFWHKKRAPGGEVLALELWNPYQVFVGKDDAGRKVFSYQGTDYAPADVVHRTRMKLPGQLRGRSVFAACRNDLAPVLNTRNFAGTIFDPGAMTAGILKSDQALTGADAKAARRVWNFQDPETGEPITAEDNPARIRVLGKGMNYEALTINPKDAQWLESQGFDVTKIARMFGVPASLMLAALEGNSQTYSNVEQDWLAFVRFTLMNYLRKIESAFSELLPAGQSAVFNIESLLRADTLTRYQAYNLATWLTDDEKRAIENMPPLTDSQRAALAAKPAATPAPEGATK
jgi:HK97 family phage portal protein